MRATTVRFSEDLWALLDEEAGRQGISAAQFVRDATLLRLGALAGRRDDPDAIASLEDLAAGTIGRQRRRRPQLPPVIHDEARLAELRGTGLMNGRHEASFDRISRTAARAVDAPMVIVSLIGDEMQFVKSCVGFDSDQREFPVEQTICHLGLASPDPLVIDDTTEDTRLTGNPLVEQVGVRSYAGAPLVSSSGNALGILCAIDFEPRSWTDDQVETLVALAGALTAQVELHAIR